MSFAVIKGEKVLFFNLFRQLSRLFRTVVVFNRF